MMRLANCLVKPEEPSEHRMMRFLFRADGSAHICVSFIPFSRVLSIPQESNQNQKDYFQLKIILSAVANF